MAESGLSPGSACADASSSLRDKLAAVLPEGFRFGIHHLSTPPTRTDALCSPPPGERPDRTYCERHFLAVSISAAATPPEAQRPERPQRPEDQDQEHALVLGVEVFLYTTAHSTTLFVSKADSTGFLHRLGLPRGAPSPIREVCAAFVRDLVEQRRRGGVPFVVSLFARAQDQYLFPGSVEYGGKHVLDDRGLVRWWCRVLDPLVRAPPRGGCGLQPAWRNARGYLVVPGLDAYEARALVPRRADATAFTSTSTSNSARTTTTTTTTTAWAVNEDPLERISHYHREFDWVPPRCLIPRFPDDPKSRFRDELDSEADRTGGMRKTGSWRTVKTLGMFWEMMAFRQECSSGRMTGFIWVVFDDLEDEKAAKPGHVGKSQEGAGEGEVRQRTPKENAPDAAAAPETPTTQRIMNVTPSTTPRRLFPRKGTGSSTVNGNGNGNGGPVNSKGDVEARKPSRTKTLGSAPKHKKKRRAKLRGVIVPRQPRIKTKQRNYLLERPVSTAYYSWPAQGRGARIVDEADYKRILELLVHLDFSTLDKAVSSTGRWVSEAGVGWRRGGYEVVGTRQVAAQLAGNGLQQGAGTTAAAATETAAATVNNLSGLVKRKRTETVGEGEAPRADERGSTSKVNVLSGGLVRRKRKDHDGSDGGAEARRP